MHPDVDWSHLALAKDVEGDDPDETQEIRELVDEAHGYLMSQSWCRGIDCTYIGLAVGGVVLIAFVQFIPTTPDPSIPSAVWVVVGDLPPAYIHPDFARDAREVLAAYVGEMAEWVSRVQAGAALDDSVIPVNVDPSPESAAELASRLEMIREQLLSREPNETPGFIGSD